MGLESKRGKMYGKANNKNAEEIYYIMNEEFSDMEEQDL